ncbi:MAG: c-type cytochrome [Tropicimonas sp.]|uniref:c-type cytochrome n=1 Tax=Tropicimonas sp. TaxID=2067044 RepID=UPI003A8406C2
MRKFLIAAIAVSIPALAIADAATDAVKARQEHMKGYGQNVGVLSKMAKGEVDFDSAAAQQAADALAELAGKDASGYWLPGTSSDDMPGVSYAYPALWQDGAKAGEIAGQLREAALALQGVAGTDRAAMAKALGDVGKTCQDCHKDFRMKKD